MESARAHHLTLNVHFQAKQVQIETRVFEWWSQEIHNNPMMHSCSECNHGCLSPLASFNSTVPWTGLRNAKLSHVDKKHGSFEPSALEY